MDAPPDFDVRVGIYTFRVGGDLRVDRDATRSFLEGFIARHGGEPKEAFEASLSDEFGAYFSCGIMPALHFQGTTGFFVLITSIGTPNTTPARNPTGKPRDK